jgi:hypothetical protein
MLPRSGGSAWECISVGCCLISSLEKRSLRAWVLRRSLGTIIAEFDGFRFLILPKWLLRAETYPELIYKSEDCPQWV